MTLVWYLVAAFAEIASCFAFWAWAQLDKSPLWLIPGLASLALFAWILTRADSAIAGRAYAAYGGVYIGNMRDFTLALACFVLLMAWNMPPWGVVIVAASAIRPRVLRLHHEERVLIEASSRGSTVPE